MSLTTIPVSTEVRERLKQIASKGETYDAVLRRLIEVSEARMLHERERRILETEEFVPLDQA
jgi:predicted CopG family antitoxin